MSNVVMILFPTGRVVWTSGQTFYDGATEDFDGNPLVYRDGPKKGQPRTQFAFGYAIEKTAASLQPSLKLSAALAAQGHTLESLRAQNWTDQALVSAGHAIAVPGWANEPWGKQIYETGTAAFRNGETLRADFSWKIADGDSAVPGKPYRGKPGRANKDKEGYPGCWVLTFSSDFAPKVCDAQGEPIAADNHIVKCGHYVQVYGSVLGNSGASPGVYLNHNAVAYRAWGKEIFQGIDTRTVGFGKDALPPGASVVPQGNASIPAPGGVPAPSLPSPAGVAPASMSLPAPAPIPASGVTTSPSNPLPPAPTLVQPHTGILTVPVPGAAAPTPPAPPAPPAEPQMSAAAKAAGYTYAALKAANWSDAQMRAAGHII